MCLALTTQLCSVRKPCLFHCSTISRDTIPSLSSMKSRGPARHTHNAHDPEWRRKTERKKERNRLWKTHNATCSAMSRQSKQLVGEHMECLSVKHPDISLRRSGGQKHDSNANDTPWMCAPCTLSNRCFKELSWTCRETVASRYGAAWVSVWNHVSGHLVMPTCFCFFRSVFGLHQQPPNAPLSTSH